MLELKRIVAFVITAQPEEAIRFYRDRLGLKFVKDDGFALVFDAYGTTLRIGKMKAGQFTPARYTLLGWEVEGVEDAAAQLALRGVSFEKYPQLPQYEKGIWTAPGGDKVAWFKDPDGNALSVSQHRSAGV
jgi:catechol 2,3-dioxygenase-like lactoylglutathione lyase family enzyme